MREDVERIHHIFGALSDRAVDLPGAAQGYLLSLELENRSPATVENNRGVLSRFLWFAEQAHFPCKFPEITSAHIRVFLSYVQTNPQRWTHRDNAPSCKQVKASTVRCYRSVLHGWWNWAIREGLVETNVVDRVRVPKVEENLIEGLSEAEVRQLIETCRRGCSENRRRDTAIVLILLDTGIRASELCSIQLKDVDLDTGRIRIRGKGRKERWVSLSAMTAKATWDYITKERPQTLRGELFLGKGAIPISRSGLGQLLERRSQEAKIRRVHPHLLRHTFALSWARSGGPLQGLQTLLGHSKPTMSLRYGRMASEEAAELHRQYSPVERLGLRFREKDTKKR